MPVVLLEASSRVIHVIHQLHSPGSCGVGLYRIGLDWDVWVFVDEIYLPSIFYCELAGMVSEIIYLGKPNLQNGDSLSVNSPIIVNHDPKVSSVLLE